jgi:hypothetical protein
VICTSHPTSSFHAFLVHIFWNELDLVPFQLLRDCFKVLIHALVRGDMRKDELLLFQYFNAESVYLISLWAFPVFPSKKLIELL